MQSPFDILDVAEDADDASIKKAYLQQVRAYPPERYPEQFQQIRAAFEAIASKRQRLVYQLFYNEPPHSEALMGHVLKHNNTQQRPTEAQFMQALAESLKP
ncbi:J domain-containing protein [Candidatus Venteria ishoeyi]|uniref:Chaperone protein DnaJ n=1 Tax=Candidatus Venteria ishoeyi TaxID=1899563 RepID=A0A1H6F9X0_9GAMM|nr:J domain-containing protein [Candidatus Venteria ishoeyi]SEH06171.1 Chaperone protein DnaJ [Candidatus Venteria ishoeyi]